MNVKTGSKKNVSLGFSVLNEIFKHSKRYLLDFEIYIIHYKHSFWINLNLYSEQTIQNFKI